MSTGTTRRTMIAGCLDCSGSDVKWTGDEAEASAAEHNRLLKHRTWFDSMTTIRWGCRDYEVEAQHQSMTA